MGGTGQVKRITSTPFGDYTQIVECPDCSNDKSSNNNLDKFVKSLEENNSEDFKGFGDLFEEFFNGFG